MSPPPLHLSENEGKGKPRTNNTSKHAITPISDNLTAFDNRFGRFGRVQSEGIWKFFPLLSAIICNTVGLSLISIERAGRQDFLDMIARPSRY